MVMTRRTVTRRRMVMTRRMVTRRRMVMTCRTVTRRRMVMARGTVTGHQVAGRGRLDKRGGRDHESSRSEAHAEQPSHVTPFTRLARSRTDARRPNDVPSGPSTTASSSF